MPSNPIIFTASVTFPHLLVSPNAEEFASFKISPVMETSCEISIAISLMFESGLSSIPLNFVIFRGNCGRSFIVFCSSSEITETSFANSLFIGRRICVFVTPFSQNVLKLSSDIPSFLSIRIIITRPRPAPSESSRT